MDYIFKELVYEPYDFTFLSSKNQILTCNFSRKSLTVYDLNYCEIKTINKLNNFEFSPFSLTTNSKDKIFICDPSSNYVFLLDFNFNFIKKIGSKGINDDDKFNCPIDIYYSNSKVYVCDAKNKRIKIFNENLVYQDKYIVTYEPRQFKILKKTAVVTQISRDSPINIYSINPFQFKIIINNFTASAIYCLKDMFLAFDDINTKICFYNDEGQLKEEVNLKTEINKKLKFREAEDKLPESIKLSVYDNQLILTSWNSKTLVTFRNAFEQ